MKITRNRLFYSLLKKNSKKTLENLKYCYVDGHFDLSLKFGSGPRRNR